MKVAFVNENTLGHASYLLPFVRHFQQNPSFGIEPVLLNATPLPPALERKANFTIRGLRRWGLDFHNARWRFTVSKHVGNELERIHSESTLDAIVANTQSVALGLRTLARKVPLIISLDATFKQLSQDRWFAPNFGTRCFLRWTTGGLRQAEMKILNAASFLFPWSRRAADSLKQDYAIAGEKLSVLPPSAPIEAIRCPQKKGGKPKLLFVGGDFKRKGGPFALKLFRASFAENCELHLVTRQSLPKFPGVFAHENVMPHSDRWKQIWEQSDLFLFPSTLETFGIVLVEALAFQVPVIASTAGAAAEILADGAAGWIIPDQVPARWAEQIHEILENPALAQAKVARGRQIVEEHFNLNKNAELLAARLHAVLSTLGPGAAARADKLATRDN